MVLRELGSIVVVLGSRIFSLWMTRYFLPWQRLLEIQMLLFSYGEASSQIINFAKLGVLLSNNASEEDYFRVCNLLGVNKLEQGSSYLGLPSSMGRSIGKCLNFILDCIRDKLKG